jgi:hypothetical protein
MHKEALEKHLKNRLGELFDLDYDLAAKRPSCKLCITLRAYSVRALSQYDRGETQVACLSELNHSANPTQPARASFVAKCLKLE